MRKIERSGRPLRHEGKANRISIGDLHLSVWRTGSAPHTIVFIHGNSACKEVFYEQFDALSRTGYSLVAIDLPGHGCSADAPHPEKTYTISGYALILKKLLDQLELHRPLVVGWSLGGHIAIEMAGRGVDLAGLALCGTPPAGPGLEEMSAAFTTDPAMAVTMEENPSQDELNLYTESLYACLPEIPQHFLNAASRTDGRARRIMGENWARGLEGCHQKTVIAGWERPICVMHGAQENFFTLNYLENLTWRNLWRGQINTIAEAGHAPFIERPQCYNALLADFAQDVFKSENL